MFSSWNKVTIYYYYLLYTCAVYTLSLIHISLVASPSLGLTGRHLVIVHCYIIKGKPVEKFSGYITPHKHDAQLLVSYLLDDTTYLELPTSSLLKHMMVTGELVMSGSFSSVQIL